MDVPIGPRIAAGCVFGLGFAVLGALPGMLSLLARPYVTITDPGAIRNWEYLEMFFHLSALGARIGAIVGFFLGVI